MTLREIIENKRKKMSMKDVYDAIPDLEARIVTGILNDNKWMIECDNSSRLSLEDIPLGYEEIFTRWAEDEGLAVTETWVNNKRYLVLMIEGD